MNENFYETGSTRPPKSRVWIVLLLVLLIFIGGIITAMGILNIKLWSAFSLGGEDTVPLVFTRMESTAPAATGAPCPQTADSAPNASLGVTTETVSAFMRMYYHLPQGVYIPRVPVGSSAAEAGILPGDILLSLNGEQVPDTDTLLALMCGYEPGEAVSLTLYRDGKELSLELVLTQGN